jgi:hypothetical protein
MAGDDMSFIRRRVQRACGMALCISADLKHCACHPWRDVIASFIPSQAIRGLAFSGAYTR